jgi:hypothetical protein
MVYKILVRIKLGELDTILLPENFAPERTISDSRV